jgi:alpha-methylacyl-CoA racemase
MNHQISISVYETKDGRFMALGAIEPQFYQVFLEKSELSELEGLPDQMDQSEWENLRRIIAEKFLKKTQAEWTEIFNLTDACVSPVMTAEEAAENEHNKER